MNKCIARELRNKLTSLSAVAVTFATITVVPAATTIVAIASGTVAHPTKATSMDRTSSNRRDRHAEIGPRDKGHYLATGYRVNTLHFAAHEPGSEIW
jgi:hypothetical protein